MVVEEVPGAVAWAAGWNTRLRRLACAAAALPVPAAKLRV